MTTKKQKKLITKDGLEKLKRELGKRESKVRKEIADKLDEAKKSGDLSENSAYISALEEYQMNEARIKELKKEIAEVKIAPNRSGDHIIDIGDRVKVKNGDGNEIIYEIVGEKEGDPLENKVSASSLVGKKLVGKKKGDKVEVDLPKGKKKIEIVEVK